VFLKSGKRIYIKGSYTFHYPWGKKAYIFRRKEKKKRDTLYIEVVSLHCTRYGVNGAARGKHQTQEVFISAKYNLENKHQDAHRKQT